MSAGPARRSRQLALLGTGVLAAHVVLLQGAPPTLAPAREATLAQFTTRSIAPPVPPPLPVAAPEPPPARPAATAARPRPAVRAPVAAPAEAIAARPAAPAPPPAAAPPALALPGAAVPLPSAVLHYELTVRSRGVTLAGEARLDWRHDGQRYTASLALSAPGLRERVWESVGGIAADGLRPDRFSDRSRSAQATHFDRAAGRVVFSNNQPEAAWSEGMQDRLSVVLQLGMLVAAAPQRFPPGAEIVLPTATTRQAEEWQFRVVGEEELALPGGPLRTLKLEKLPRREYDQRVELWLAPGQAYAPVRLRLTNADGGWVDQRWSSTDRG